MKHLEMPTLSYVKNLEDRLSILEKMVRGMVEEELPDKVELVSCHVFNNGWIEMIIKVNDKKHHLTHNPEKERRVAKPSI